MLPLGSHCCFCRGDPHLFPRNCRRTDRPKTTTSVLVLTSRTAAAAAAGHTKSHHGTWIRGSEFCISGSRVAEEDGKQEVVRAVTKQELSQPDWTLARNETTSDAHVTDNFNSCGMCCTCPPVPCWTHSKDQDSTTTGAYVNWAAAAEPCLGARSILCQHCTHTPDL